MNQTRNNIPMLALRGVVAFPDSYMQIEINRDESLAAVMAALDNDRYIFMTAQKDIACEKPGFDDVCLVGCVAKVKQFVRIDGGAIAVFDGAWRARLTAIDRSQPFMAVTVERCDISPASASEAENEALVRELRSMFSHFAAAIPNMPGEVIARVIRESDPVALASFISSNLPVSWEKKQTLLERRNGSELIFALISLLRDESEIREYEADIKDRVSAIIQKNNRDYYLREELRLIKDELGESDEEYFDDVDEFTERIASLKAGDDVKEKLTKEVRRLSRMPYNSHDASVLGTYLDYCLSLPWENYSNAEVDMDKCRRILDKSHYGMDKVKERILEMISVRKLTGDFAGQIICLVGPPGVGKTSIGRAIADCLGREYHRISLGGIKDEAEIRGHRRTYVGAVAGRIIEEINLGKTSDPVILLDEVDKVGSDFKGDCSAALLEVLDPEQNKFFKDHYVDLPYDLSRAVFIATANDASAIPAPLYDRMEIIELPSYTREEKFHIAKEHLIEKQRKKHGLNSRNFRITDAALYSIIDDYTRESGVRTLERKIAALCRKAAAKVADDEKATVSVTGKRLAEMLGPKKYFEDEKSPGEVGVVNGLAWTSVGGEIMKLEAAALPGNGKIELTGSLGNVMQESAKTAISFVRSVADEYGIDAEFYKKNDIHIHATEAAVPKDGPSAGVTMAVAILSALTDKPVRGDVAMTGELTLHGKVTPIGGLREKTMAAYRAGIDTVLIPYANTKDLAELDPAVTERIRFVPCKSVREVFKEAFN